MICAGLTGGLASGKSFVAAILADLGCEVIEADRLGHQALSPDGEAYAPTVEAFGAEIVARDGSIDRSQLAAIVFRDAKKLALLNSIIHPVVFRSEDRLIQGAGERDPNAVVVVEAAILIESGSYRRFDKIVLVYCADEQQIERAVQRGLSREEALRRMERQMPTQEKMKYADYLIDTSGSEDSTCVQTLEVYRTLRSLA